MNGILFVTLFVAGALSTGLLLHWMAVSTRRTR